MVKKDKQLGELMKTIILMDNLDLVEIGSVVTLKNELNDLRLVVTNYDKSLNKIDFGEDKILMTEYITADTYHDFKLEIA